MASSLHTPALSTGIDETAGAAGAPEIGAAGAGTAETPGMETPEIDGGGEGAPVKG